MNYKAQPEHQHWRVVAATLHNTHAYYSQFSGLMQSALTDGLSELEKQLEVNFCTLSYEHKASE